MTAIDGKIWLVLGYVYLSLTVENCHLCRTSLQCYVQLNPGLSSSKDYKFL